MSQVRHLEPSDYREVPWQNGRGTTVELACWPPAASLARGELDWRVSRARIDAAGSFSPMPGLERILVVIAGAGLELQHEHDAPRARLRPFEPYRFEGAWKTSATLAGGPALAFNVVFAPGRIRASVEATRLGTRRLRAGLDAEEAFLHLVEGAARARVSGEEQPVTLAAGESLWLRELPCGAELDVLGEQAGTSLLLVRLRSAGEGA